MKADRSILRRLIRTPCWFESLILRLESAETQFRYCLSQIRYGTRYLALQLSTADIQCCDNGPEGEARTQLETRMRAQRERRGVGGSEHAPSCA
jgi:hypothetical protein